MDLSGKKGVIVGVANDKSIAFGCAKVLAKLGAELYITYQNEKTLQYITPLLPDLKNPNICALDLTQDAELDVLAKQLKSEWGEVDFIIHSVAWSPLNDLHESVLNASREGFLAAMDISCHSFIRLVNKLEPLMCSGASVITMSYYGSQKVVDNYNLMGPVKAALESSVRYLAAELGEQMIRVNVISPGPMPTRAGSGIKGFDQLMDGAVVHSPLHALATPEDVGNLAAFLVSDLSKHITGHTLYVDAGDHIMY